jgi:hypothetical protein
MTEKNELYEKMIQYIESEAEILIPMDELSNKDGSRITKHQYGLVMIKYLCEELREKFLKD